MKTINKILLFCLLLFAMNTSKAQTAPDTSNVPQSAKLDTTKVYFSVLELRTVSDYLKEVEYRRTQDSLYQDQIKIYESLLTSFGVKDQLYIQKINGLNEQIKLITPPWYDHFLVGMVPGTLMMVLAVILALR